MATPPIRLRSLAAALVAILAVAAPLACTGDDTAPLSCRGLRTGSYEPGATTTGVAAGSQLRQVSGDIVVREAGTIIENQDIHGYVDVRAADVTIRNSIVRGGAAATGSRALILATNRDVRRLRVEGVKLVPSNPSQFVNGIMGHDYTARCVDVAETTDGFRAFNAVEPARPTNVTITQSYCHDLAYWSPASGHADNQTHNDCFQGEGATDVALTFNLLHAYVSTTVGSLNHPPDRPQALSALMVNDLVVAGVRYQPTRWVVYGNWIDGGFIAVNCGDSAVATDLGSMLRNVFDYGQWHQGPPTHTITCNANIVVNTGDGTADQNVYRDSVPIRVRHNG